MSNKKIKVHCVDFWKEFNKDTKSFEEFNPSFDIFDKWIKINHDQYEHDPIKPDILLFSVFGDQHLKYENCIKVLFSGESIKPPKNEYDFSVSFDDNSDTNLLFPVVFFCYMPANTTISSNDIIPILKKTKTPIEIPNRFCNFIYQVDWEARNNFRKTKRKAFCERLQQYKHVDCPGKVLNNMPNFGGGRYINWVEDKFQFLKNYKFTIAFENDSEYNYVTEKIFQPFLAGSIPIYWGAPNIQEFFNPKCFINVMDFNNFEEVIEYIIEIDKDEKLYMSFFKEPPIINGSKLNNLTNENVTSFFNNIINSVKK